MSERVISYDPMTVISPVSPFDVTPTEREARRLLCLGTSSDTAEAHHLLRTADPAERRGEWHFLMGICALRRGYVDDAQAYLDSACTIASALARHEYNALYESVRQTFAKRGTNEEGEPRDRACFSGADCWDCCECLECCDCDGSDGCCDCCGCDDCCN